MLGLRYNSSNGTELFLTKDKLDEREREREG